jgi:cytochrome c biogenesis protein CcdA
VLALFALVVSIGLVDSLNPSTVGPALVIAIGDRASVRLTAFISGVFVVSMVAGVALLLGPGQALLDAIPHPSAGTKHLAQLAGGLLLLALATLSWRARHRLQRQLTASNRHPARSSVTAALALGAAIMAVEVPTAFPYFAAIAAILSAHLSLPQQIALLATYNLAFVLPLLAILAASAATGKQARHRLQRLRTWFARRAGLIISTVAASAGTALVVVGANGLV